MHTHTEPSTQTGIKLAIKLVIFSFADDAQPTEPHRWGQYLQIYFLSVNWKNLATKLIKMSFSLYIKKQLYVWLLSGNFKHSVKSQKCISQLLGSFCSALYCTFFGKYFLNLNIQFNLEWQETDFQDKGYFILGSVNS